jgi:hypothetical protein
MKWTNFWINVQLRSNIVKIIFHTFYVLICNLAQKLIHKIIILYDFAAQPPFVKRHYVKPQFVELQFVKFLK